MKARRTQRDPLLLEVAAAIGAGGISIKSIHDERLFVDGETYPDGRIVINPVLNCVDTAVHECLHRLRPEWSEASVRRRTAMLMRQMTYPEIDKIYQLVVVSVAAGKGNREKPKVRGSRRRNRRAAQQQKSRLRRRSRSAVQSPKRRTARG